MTWIAQAIGLRKRPWAVNGNICTVFLSPFAATPLTLNGTTTCHPTDKASLTSSSVMTSAVGMGANVFDGMLRWARAGEGPTVDGCARIQWV